MFLLWLRFVLLKPPGGRYNSMTELYLTPLSLVRHAVIQPCALYPERSPLEADLVLRAVVRVEPEVRP